jgi:hypothetical protein
VQQRRRERVLDCGFLAKAYGDAALSDLLRRDPIDATANLTMARVLARQGRYDERRHFMIE